MEARSLVEGMRAEYIYASVKYNARLSEGTRVMGVSCEVFNHMRYWT